MYLDALMVKIRDQGVVDNKSRVPRVGIDADGEKEVLGLWLRPARARSSG